MRLLHFTPTFPAFISAFISVFMAAAVSTAVAQTTDDSQQKQIRTLVSSTYDQPGHKVETSPIVIANGYAIADWVQGEKGGRALLRNTKGKWEIMACGGDGLKDIKTLSDAGIAKETAKNLVAQLTRAEQSVSPDRIKRFGLFGTPNDPRLTEHHNHSQP